MTPHFYVICRYIKSGRTSHALSSSAGIQKDLWGCLYRNGMKLSKGKVQHLDFERRRSRAPVPAGPAWGAALWKSSLSKLSVTRCVPWLRSNSIPCCMNRNRARWCITVLTSLLGACFTAASRIVHPLLATQYEKERLHHKIKSELYDYFVMTNRIIKPQWWSRTCFKSLSTFSSNNWWILRHLRVLGLGWTQK